MGSMAIARRTGPSEAATPVAARRTITTVKLTGSDGLKPGIRNIASGRVTTSAIPNPNASPRARLRAPHPSKALQVDQQAHLLFLPFVLAVAAAGLAGVGGVLHHEIEDRAELRPIKVLDGSPEPIEQVDGALRPAADEFGQICRHDNPWATRGPKSGGSKRHTAGARQIPHF